MCLCTIGVFSIFFCRVSWNDSQENASSTDEFLDKLLIYLSSVFLMLMFTMHFWIKSLTRRMSDSKKIPCCSKDKFSQWHPRWVAESELWWHVTVNPWAIIPWKLYFQEQYFFSLSSPWAACSKGWLNYRLVSWTLMKLKEGTLSWSCLHGSAEFQLLL